MNVQVVVCNYIGMNNIKFAKDITEKEYKQNNTIYIIFEIEALKPYI